MMVRLPTHICVTRPHWVKWLGHCFQNVISFYDAVHLMCNIFIWNWSNTMNVQSALWILMAWCFSTRASVATVLIIHPCISRCLRVNTLRQRQNARHLPYDIFKCILLNENFWIFNKISLKYHDVPLGCNWWYVSIGSDNGQVLNKR